MFAYSSLFCLLDLSGLRPVLPGSVCSTAAFAAPGHASSTAVYAVPRHICVPLLKYSSLYGRWSRVPNFRQKNYSAEYERRRNKRLFRRNSVCFAEQKALGIPLRFVS
jgi:hypothetical protein